MTMRKVLPFLLSLLGVVLLGTSLAGDVTSLGDYEARAPRAWEQFDLNLAEDARTYDALLQRATLSAGQPLEALSPEQTMDALYKTVTERFTHGLARHNIFSNWLLWTLGQLHPAFSTVHDEESLVSRGASTFCSQSSYVLLSLANDVGIPSRHVGLNGHVVMEAYYDGKWHMYDPDMEVVVPDESGRLLSVSALAAREDLLRQAYAGPRATVIPFFTSTVDNTFMSYPPGAWFVWKSQVLYLFEQIAAYLKYLLALLLVILGVTAARTWRL